MNHADDTGTAGAGRLGPAPTQSQPGPASSEILTESPVQMAILADILALLLGGEPGQGGLR